LVPDLDFPTDRSVGSVGTMGSRSQPGRGVRRMAREFPSSREKILDVAEALFARRGYTGVGLREVAVAAGLGKSSLFHHFRSKTQLYCEVLARVLERIREPLDVVLESTDDPARKLDRCVDALVDSLAEHPPTARLLLRSLFEEDDLSPEAPGVLAVEQSLSELLERLQQLLSEGVEAGVFRPVSVPHTLQTLIGATVYHFASGDLGAGLLGQPLLSAEAVRRRKLEVKNLLHHGLVAAVER
jgi:TetR/AcrR family transcriptional regulator